MSKWIFIYMPRYNIHTQKSPASPVRHPTPFGTTTVPRPPHTSALGVPGERIAADTRLGERGAWIGALVGTDRSFSGNGTGTRERKGSQHIRKPFHTSPSYVGNVRSNGDATQEKRRGRNLSFSGLGCMSPRSLHFQRGRQQ